MRALLPAFLSLACALASSCAAKPRDEGLVLADPNEYGGRTVRILTPESPDSSSIDQARDAKGRLRARTVRYPENFLKEDPRTEGLFLYDEAGRLLRAEYRFSEAFSAAHHGLAAQVLVFSPEGRVAGTERLYDGRDPSMPARVAGSEPPGELP